MKTKTTDESLYEAIGRSYKPMTAMAQEAHLESITMLCEQIVYQSMLVKMVREALYQEFARRADVHWDGLAKMGRDYAAGVKGRAATIHARIYDSFIKAAEYFREGNHMAGAGIIANANLHPKFFVDAESEGSVYNWLMIAAVHGATPSSPDQIAAKQALDKIKLLNEYRTSLFNSVLNMVAEVANNVSTRVSGDIVQYPDLVQEGLTAAWNATLRYNRADTKFSSYAHFQIQGAIRNYVSDHTRTVRLPRYQVERLGPVQEVLDGSNAMDYELLAKMASKVLHDQKGRKLKRYEVYTPEEVESLINSMDGAISLDAPVDAGDETITVSDVLVTDSERNETALEEWMVGRGLRRHLKENLSKIERNVLAVRWGLDDSYDTPQGLDETARIVKIRFPDEKMNKSKVKEIEMRAMRHLRHGDDNAKLKELWKASETNVTRSAT